jgi:hypothetical protein
MADYESALIFLFGFSLARGMGSSLILFGADDLELPFNFSRAEDRRLVLLKRKSLLEEE